MNTKSVISGLMAVCVMASAPAFAQRYDYGNTRNDQGQRGYDNGRYQDRAQTTARDSNERGDRHQRDDRYGRSGYGQTDSGYGHSDRGYGQSNSGYGHSDRGYGQSNSGYYGARNDGYRQEMHRGGYLPSEYRDNRYVVNDWRSRHLSAPPRGYQWVQANNNDYVLAALATGIIAQVLLNN